jgi:hypothetical protein
VGPKRHQEEFLLASKLSILKTNNNNKTTNNNQLGAAVLQTFTLLAPQICMQPTLMYTSADVQIE